MKTNTIKNWAIDDRPREKMLSLGKSHLSDVELLAILINTGSKEQSALDLGRALMHSTENNLRKLAQLEIEEMTNIKGIGQAKAVTITAAFELGKRFMSSEQKLNPSIRCSQDAYQLLLPKLSHLKHEEFWVIYLNRSNAVLAMDCLSKGGTSQTTCDVKIIGKRALNLLAHAIVVAHNHPSGNTTVSTADKNITHKIKSMLEIMDMQLLDHIIVCHQDYVSFADEGLL